MRYAILGGDQRFVHLARMFRESGRISAPFLQEESCGERPLQDLGKFDCILSNWPMKWPLSKYTGSEDEILGNIAPGSVLLLCGPGFPGKKRWDLQYVNLWADEILQLENAWLTAEAAIGTTMSKDEIPGSNCMVIGFGRIGRALTQMLQNFGANVIVISRSTDKRRQAATSGVSAAAPTELEHLLPGQKFIFSTPPAMVMNERMLKCVSLDAVLVDLASPPYGVDMTAAQRLGLNACREPGLPGRYCPEDAARVLYNAIIRWEEGEYDKT